MSSILYALLWYKGNAKIIYGVDWSPFTWWLSTGLITNYLGLLSWWFFVKEYNIWGAIAITYLLHTIIELSLSFYYFESPTDMQYLGLVFLVFGSFLVLK